MFWVHWSNLVDTRDGLVTQEQEIRDVEVEAENKDDEGGGSENKFSIMKIMNPRSNTRP